MPAVRSQPLENQTALECFLARVERRAFKMAEFATRDREEALDIVQDAMLNLVRNYGHLGEDAWGGLFQRILQSRIYDWHRRRRTLLRWRTWITLRFDDDAQEPDDGLELLEDAAMPDPPRLIASERARVAMESAISALPLRQQQAFLLREWEGLSVKETAAAMVCSEGSVKTHYFRAVNALRLTLAEHQP